jgi:hypothetical protein
MILIKNTFFLLINFILINYKFVLTGKKLKFKNL